MTYSVGRDYQTANRYEFCIFDGEKLIAREGGFKTTRAARFAAAKWIAATYAVGAA